MPLFPTSGRPGPRPWPARGCHAAPRRHGREQALALAAVAVATISTGCDGVQSALAPAGDSADRLATLFWWMTGGAIVIWAAVVALAIYAMFVAPEREHPRAPRRLILWGGVIAPTAVLGLLLAWGLSLIPRELAAAPAGSLRVQVSGEQWWWRVRYLGPDGRVTAELANELHLPADQPVALELDSPDVIHSFWIPSLGGKVDMIPGRTTTLTLTARRPGLLRGVCAEYCGTSHAFMAFPVVVEDAASFAAWLEGQAAPARDPLEPLTVRGRDRFLAHGCGSCHTVRGTPARGTIGPDLTHVGGRRTLAAGLLEARVATFRRWIAEPDSLKPGVHMPAFDMIPAAELDAIAAYLESLE